MNHPNGQLNGSGKRDETNVSSLDEARRRAAEKAKAERRAGMPGEGRTLRDWLIGGTILAIAIATIVAVILDLGGAPAGGS